MKLFSLFALVAMTSGLPVEETSVDLLPPENVDVDVGVTRVGCIIRSYSGDNCDGSNLYAYEYAPTPNTCRSCRQFGGSHSYRLEGDCTRYFEFHTRPTNCDEGGPDYVAGAGTPGSQCIHVNTGSAWNSGYICFGP